MVARSDCGCGRAPAKNEATDADSVRIQWMRLFPATIFVLVLGGIAFPFACAGLLLILTLTPEKEFKICANCQTGSAVCVQRWMVQALLGIISPHHPGARGIDPARWSHRYQSDSITVIRRVRGDSATCATQRPDHHDNVATAGGPSDQEMHHLMTTREEPPCI